MTGGVGVGGGSAASRRQCAVSAAPHSVRHDELARLERALTRAVAPRPARASADLTAPADADAPPDDRRWDGIAAELGVGLQQLRDLSHGLHPGLLDAEGLGPALQAHLRRSGTRATLVIGEVARGRRFDFAVEAAVYGCAADAARTLGHLRRCAVDLDGSGRLRLTLSGPAGRSGRNGLTARLRDRVEGRGGISEHRVDGCTTWQLDIPTVRPR